MAARATAGFINGEVAAIAVYMQDHVAGIVAESGIGVSGHVV